jgi:hypothetical protein
MNPICKSYTATTKLDFIHDKRDISTVETILASFFLLIISNGNIKKKFYFDTKHIISSPQQMLL